MDVDVYGSPTDCLKTKARNVTKNKILFQIHNQILYKTNDLESICYVFSGFSKFCVMETITAKQPIVLLKFSNLFQQQLNDTIPVATIPLDIHKTLIRLSYVFHLLGIIVAWKAIKQVCDDKILYEISFITYNSHIQTTNYRHRYRYRYRYGCSNIQKYGYAFIYYENYRFHLIELKIEKKSCEKKLLKTMKN